MSLRHLLYLHGFRSSPQSTKARFVAQWMSEHRPDVAWWCPQLPPSPREAMALVLDHVASWPADSAAVIGSSLGGFYATVVAERLGFRAALVNPAVEPARDLAAYIGVQKAWHGDDEFYFRAAYVDELAALRPTAITHPERYYALIAKGDEVLDWREMSARYGGCEQHIIDGGDHAVSDFPLYWPEIARFIDASVAPPSPADPSSG